MAQGQDNQGFPKLDIRAAKALRPRTFKLEISSILGGETPVAYTAAKDQYLPSLGINPFAKVRDNGVGSYLFPFNIQTSGIIRPSNNQPMANNPIAHWPTWIDLEPKASNFYVYDSVGSAYSNNIQNNTVTALNDAGTLSSSSGNGMTYYDNYMYFATNTDITRFGPLNGAAGFVPNYWTSTLGKAALTNTTYPNVGAGSFLLPNHFLHRHSDGKLYIADVVGNQGTLHVISTTKTTVEGDTDAGSKASALTFGYGLWPTAIETYGSNIVVGLYEGGTSVGSKRAKIAFWDTTSQSFTSITFPEFPDALITAIKNVDGVLYIVSSNPFQRGYRITQYIGGSSFQEVDFVDGGSTPLPGAIDGNSGQLLVATSLLYDSVSGDTPCIISYGRPRSGMKSGRFNIIRGKNNSGSSYTAFKVIPVATGSTVQFQSYYAGWGTTLTPTTANNGIDFDATNADFSVYPSRWRSQIFKFASPFKITKVRAPLICNTGSVNQVMGKNAVVDLNYIIDNEQRVINVTGAISSTTVNQYNVLNHRPTEVTGGQNMFIEFAWTGTDYVGIGLPIMIEGEIFDD